MLNFRVETWSLGIAIRQFVKGTQKDTALETQRQAKLLCIELAAQASPKPKGVSGLAAAIPKIWGRRIRGELGAIIKGVGSLGLFKIARINSPLVFKNSYYPGKVRPQMRTVTKMYKNPRGEVVGKQVTEISALHRIMEASQKSPQKALLALRQVLKNRLQGEAPLVWKNFKGRAVEEYYNTLTAKAKAKKAGRDSPKLYINTADPRPDREALAAQIDQRIGTVKAGWIQAGLAIPVKAGPRIPNWLMSKRTVGAGSVTQSGLQTGVVLTNSIGNIIGMADRTDYVRRALKTRTTKLRNGLEEALKAQARKWYSRQRLPIPSHLAAGKVNINAVDID